MTKGLALRRINRVYPVKIPEYVAAAAERTKLVRSVPVLAYASTVQTKFLKSRAGKESPVQGTPFAHVHIAGRGVMGSLNW